jgi:hypothetical protein
MLRHFYVIRVVFVLLGFTFVAPLLAEPSSAEKDQPGKKQTASKFIRLQRNADKQPIALETATVRFVPGSGEGSLVVDLIGVVHIGDRAYYQKLNKQMEQYDVLLYELVAPQGTRIPKGGKRNLDNPLALIQQMMKLALSLDLQTEQIDYTKKNFVHADLSPEQMAEAIKNRGDDALTLTLSLTADLLRQQNLQQRKQEKNPHAEQLDVDPLALFTDPEAAMKLKRTMALQMEDLESGTGALGQTLNTILITDRNQAAMKVFQTELAKGKKKIGIFYGAAHMPDFEKRLRSDFGLKRDSDQWLKAWDLEKPQKTGIEDLLKLLK